MGDCIECPGSPTKAGYMRITVDGEQVYGHRWAWERAHGPIPRGMEVMHTCDNPACWLIDHLLLGTHGDNMRDMFAKGRNRNGKERDHCAHGHPYDEANTYERKDRPGHRECRTCRRAAVRRHQKGARLG